MRNRWRTLRLRTNVTRADEQLLLEARAIERSRECGRNIENFVGMIAVPLGICGPLRVQGTCARGAFFLPLATTEAALVASYARGARGITERGGCGNALLGARIERRPARVGGGVGGGDELLR